MDMLREKLAQKLGANKVASPTTPTVLRVVTKHERGGDREHGASPRCRGRRAAKQLPSTRTPRAGEHADHWTYAGTGRSRQLGPDEAEFAKCSTAPRARARSTSRECIKVNLDAVQFDYKPAAFAS